MDQGISVASKIDLGPDGKPLLEWLSDRQYQVLALIYRFAVRERRYPTGKEVASELTKLGQPCSSSRAGQLIDILIRKGYATRKARGRYSLQLTEAAVEKLQKEIQPDLNFEG
jgi:DNA-binding MarR family transcriptional regulator